MENNETIRSTAPAAEQQVNETLKRIADAVTNVDRMWHRPYSKADLERVQKELAEMLEEAETRYNELMLDDKSDIKANEKIGEEINDDYKNYSKKKSEMESNAENDEDYADSDEAEALYDEEDELLNKYSGIRYSFAVAKASVDKYKKSDEGAMQIIQLCKNVHIMEDLINKICMNNIDKSIIAGENHFTSMRQGFQWLFRHSNNISDKVRHIDVRDKYRYFDYLKSQIITTLSDSSKTASDLDERYELMTKVYLRQRFSSKTAKIEEYKRSVGDLIEEFFHLYEFLVKFRDKLFEEEEIRDSIADANRQNNAAGSDDKAEKGRISGNGRDARVSDKIVDLSSVALRVLIDRFVSFVKISDLNFGNSTFHNSWFNYSELSNSNYAGSSFRESRMENAKVIRCDLSTCNLTGVDGSGTDFTDSNFNYSNLTGIDLNGATLNGCQFRNAIFRDVNVDTYKTALSETLTDTNRYDDSRFGKLMGIWKMLDINDSDIREKEGNYIGDIRRLYSEFTPDDIDASHENANIAVIDTDQLARLEKDIGKAASRYLKMHFAGIISAELLETASGKLRRMGKVKTQNREDSYGRVNFDTAVLRKVSAKNVQMDEMDFSHIDMDNASFEDASLSSSIFYYTKAGNTSFMRTNMNGVDCFETDFSSTNFSNSFISGSTFLNCNLNNTNWKRSIMIDTTFIDASDYVASCIDPELNTPKNEFFLQKMFAKCTEQDSNQRKIIDKYIEFEWKKQPQKFWQNDCGVIGFEGKKPKKEYWQHDCGVIESSFENALADQSRFFSIYADRSTFNNASMKNTLFGNCCIHLSDFISTDFRYACITCCSLGESNFTDANLTKTKIQFTDFCNANMKNALLNSAHLNRVLFEDANLSSLNLSRAIIENSAFVSCNIENILIQGTTFRNCVFDNIDFTSVIGRRAAKFENCIAYNCVDDSDDDFIKDTFGFNWVGGVND